MFPDRECELYPKHVTKGPGRINCTRDYCTVYVRYTPKSHLIKVDENGEESKCGEPQQMFLIWNS